MVGVQTAKGARTPEIGAESPKVADVAACVVVRIANANVCRAGQGRAGQTASLLVTHTEPKLPHPHNPPNIQAPAPPASCDDSVFTGNRHITTGQRDPTQPKNLSPITTPKTLSQSLLSCCSLCLALTLLVLGSQRASWAPHNTQHKQTKCIEHHNQQQLATECRPITSVPACALHQ